MSWILRGLVFLTLFLLPGYAHWADLAAAEVAVGERGVSVVLTYPTGLTAFADDDRNSRLSAAEVAAHQAALTRFFAGKLVLSAGGVMGRLEVAPAQAEKPLPSLGPSARSHSTLLLTYRWVKPASGLKLRYDLFLPGVFTAGCIATVLEGGKVQDVVFTPTRRDFSLGGATQPPVDFLSFLKLGINHILTGLDHLLFLISLLMLGGGLRYLLKVITAFTVAHSITLSLTALGLLALPGRFIESGIALSIAYVAAENLMGSLVGFNLGVELGQLTAVIPAFLFLLLLKRLPWEGWVRRTVSAGAVAAGLIWFVQRAFLSL